MPQPRARRKGWQAAVRVAAVFIVAALVSLPVSFVGAMTMTPWLYRLEPVLGMELAGHSGPSDWILATAFGITTIIVATLILRMMRPRVVEAHGAEQQPPQTPRA